MWICNLKPDIGPDHVRHRGEDPCERSGKPARPGAPWADLIGRGQRVMFGLAARLAATMEYKVAPGVPPDGRTDGGYEGPRHEARRRTAAESADCGRWRGPGAFRASD